MYWYYYLNDSIKHTEFRPTTSIVQDYSTIIKAVIPPDKCICKQKIRPRVM